MQARHIAKKVGAPLAAGTDGPVSGAEEAAAFAAEHGLPIAIKAAFGGGGRGLKVARTTEEIASQFESAVREAVAAFGRGECFVERYLDKPRHVETQCLADSHGNVVIVSTRDCSLQRRHQKLVEEAPAPFLTAEQDKQLRTASADILRAAGYVGAGTCEFLIGQDGTVSFLEVNTRLQVEHPVTEEVSGIDLVREMFRIADGEPLSYADPEVRGHSIEFRINAEDAGRGFLPAPGTITGWRQPSGPGVRLDAGYSAGMTVPQAFDSLIAKLIVTGRPGSRRWSGPGGRWPSSRSTACRRCCRSTAPWCATRPSPASRSRVHTRWIETEFSAEIPPYPGTAGGAADAEPRERITVEVGGKRLEVTVPGQLRRGRRPAPAQLRARATARRTARRGRRRRRRAATSW